jgi:hypothetical protein
LLVHQPATTGFVFFPLGRRITDGSTLCRHLPNAPFFLGSRCWRLLRAAVFVLGPVFHYVPPPGFPCADTLRIPCHSAVPKPVFRPSPVSAASSAPLNGREGLRDGNAIAAAVRSRSASPSPGDRRPIMQRGPSSTYLRTRSPTPASHILQPPRPAPNLHSIDHPSFPSLPPSNPHTTE